MRKVASLEVTIVLCDYMCTLLSNGTTDQTVICGLISHGD
jgi:hypothetical protein